MAGRYFNTKAQKDDTVVLVLKDRFALIFLHLKNRGYVFINELCSKNTTKNASLKTLETFLSLVFLLHIIGVSLHDKSLFCPVQRKISSEKEINYQNINTLNIIIIMVLAIWTI